MATPRQKGRDYLARESARRTKTGEGTKGLGPRGKELMNEASMSQSARAIKTRQEAERMPEGLRRPNAARRRLQPDERRD